MVTIIVMYLTTHVCQVTASYSHHVKEIFSAVITEYTDWASVARHPVTTRQHNTHTVDTHCPQCRLWLLNDSNVLS